MSIDILSLLSQLVAIDSVNPDLVPGGAGEGAIARFIADWAEKAGLETHLEEAAPGRPNVIAIARGTGGGRSLMLNGHMDTVGVAGMAAPHAPRIVDGRLYGRGAYDMKASLAACMAALAEAKTLNLRGDVIFTAVADEEYASLGTQSVVRNWRADAAIVTEPTGLRICGAHKGFVWIDIETEGVAAHGSRPDLGVDAITRMGHVLVWLDHLDQSLRASPTHPLLGSGSLHASLIQGGQELSSYPARCRVSVERRTVPGETPELALQQIQALLERVAVELPDFRASARITLAREAFEISPEAEITQILAGAATDVLGATPEWIGEPFWMDSAILSAAGIPTVIFGPSGTGAHAVEEWVDLESVGQCADVLLNTAARYCA
ncbi:MAG TPA: M20/M25/M40 family metallo-hydrolase [Thermoflexales bacterium]|nr:M20/M25/M40 family metallo-hydrolase [Anaerolineae bacterium]HQZ55187.1 M20/M25/M40 family metallo-hydrolase [Thermoflexales bacterium]HRA55456.1 M20/M25/M40 family metallo-hydrolase [Thermoflexales bacterium]